MTYREGFFKSQEDQHRMLGECLFRYFEARRTVALYELLLRNIGYTLIDVGEKLKKSEFDFTIPNIDDIEEFRTFLNKAKQVMQDVLPAVAPYLK